MMNMIPRILVLVGIFFLTCSGSVFAESEVNPSNESTNAPFSTTHQTTENYLPNTNESTENIEFLEPLPGLEGGIDASGDNPAVTIVEKYVGAIFTYGAGLVSLIAVIWIIIGGYEIMFSGAMGEVSSGKQKITQSLLGLVILFLAALILNIINPHFFHL